MLAATASQQNLRRETSSASIRTGPYKMLRKLHKSLTTKSNQDVVLIANGMFTNAGFPMEDAFVATNKANFNCESRTLDFSMPHEAADQINQWVHNKTKGGSDRPRIALLKQKEFTFCSC